MQEQKLIAHLKSTLIQISRLGTTFYQTVSAGAVQEATPNRKQARHPH